MSNVVTEETVTTFYFIINPLIDKVNTHVLYKVRKRDDILGLDQNSVIDAELYMQEFRNGLVRINEKTLALRQPTA